MPRDAIERKNLIVWRCLGAKVVGKTATFSKYLSDMCYELNTLILPTMEIFSQRLMEKQRVLEELFEQKLVFDNIMLNNGKISVEKYNRICNDIMSVSSITNAIRDILMARETCRFLSIHFRRNDLLIEFDDAYMA